MEGSIVSNGTSKNKKNKKAFKEEQQPDNEVVPEQPIEEPVIAETTEKKKKKKSKRKAQDESETPSVVVEQTETPEAAIEPPKQEKKKKKKKTEETEVVAETTVQNEGKEEVKEAFDVESYREKNRISASNKEYTPIVNFETLLPSLPSKVGEYLTHFGFKAPSLIQSEVWGYLFSKPELLRSDVVAIAETGSGKTLGFLIPTLSALVQQRESEKKQEKFRKPKILVLSPTRELAQQTFDTVKLAEKYVDVRGVCVYGGAPKEAQVALLKKGMDIVIATPGRLLDLSDDGSCQLDQVQSLVLDEADRMLDMGFEKDIRAIIARLPAKRQTLMFSATWPQAIQALALQFQSKPIKITIGSDDLVANHSITQYVEVVDDTQKPEKLSGLLRKYHKGKNNKVLVFVLYKKEAVRVEQSLLKQGYNVTSLHGDKPQSQRQQAMDEFKSGKVPLLVATDVAARGLHVTDVEYVINYSFPLTIEDYVHRIGRTGRAGKTGVSHTLFTTFDKHHAVDLVNILREAKQQIPEPLTKLMSAGSKKKEHKMYGQHYKEVDMIGSAPKHVKFGGDDDD